MVTPGVTDLGFGWFLGEGMGAAQLQVDTSTPSVKSWCGLFHQGSGRTSLGHHQALISPQACQTQCHFLFSEMLVSETWSG